MGRRYVESMQLFLISFCVDAHDTWQDVLTIRLVSEKSFGLACEKIQSEFKEARNFKNLTIGTIDRLKYK